MVPVINYSAPNYLYNCMVPVINYSAPNYLYNCIISVINYSAPNYLYNWMVSVSPGYMGEDRRGSYLINRQNGKWVN